MLAAIIPPFEIDSTIIFASSSNYFLIPAMVRQASKNADELIFVEKALSIR
jgi:hypothetical protein